MLLKKNIDSSYIAGRFPKAVFWVLCAYILVSAASSYLSERNELAGDFRTLCTVTMFVAFVALAFVFSLWFLSCFSGADKLTPARVAQMFYFAYTFTITSFVVLLIPIANPWQPDIIGPMSLVRGCVLGPAKNEDSVPGAVRCSRSEVNYLPKEIRSLYTINMTPDQGDRNVARETVKCSSASAGESCVEKNSYPWLITLGGYNGVSVGTRAHNSTSNLLPQDSSNTRNLDKTSGTENNNSRSDSNVSLPKSFPMDHERVSIIQGGFVVPFYVVLLAFIGGAVSLTRRIPEYQKRAEHTYVSTDRQPRLSDCQVREVVVFQIMQLMSAPFIAVVAFYALAPASMATAIGLAFLSGFASEVILLQVRGIIEGLQPHATAFNNPSNMPNRSIVSKTVDPPHDDGLHETGNVSGVVQDPHNHPLEGVDVHIEGLGKIATTLPDGRFLLPNIATGEQMLVLKSGVQENTIIVEVKAGKNDIGVLTLNDQGEG